jgi:hypothetical protein
MAAALSIPTRPEAGLNVLVLFLLIPFPATAVKERFIQNRSKLPIFWIYSLAKRE